MTPIRIRPRSSIADPELARAAVVDLPAAPARHRLHTPLALVQAIASFRRAGGRRARAGDRAHPRPGGRAPALNTQIIWGTTPGGRGEAPRRLVSVPAARGLQYQMRTVFPVRKGTRSTHLICRHKMPESSSPSVRMKSRTRSTADFRAFRASRRSQTACMEGPRGLPEGMASSGQRRNGPARGPRPLVGDRRRGSFQPAETVPDVATAERGGGDHIRLRSSLPTIRSSERGQRGWKLASDSALARPAT